MSTEIKRKNHFVIPIAFAVLSRTWNQNFPSSSSHITAIPSLFGLTNNLEESHQPIAYFFN